MKRTAAVAVFAFAAVLAVFGAGGVANAADTASVTVVTVGLGLLVAAGVPFDWRPTGSDGRVSGKHRSIRGHTG
jgi:hypothetical protein